MLPRQPLRQQARRFACSFWTEAASPPLFNPFYCAQEERQGVCTCARGWFWLRHACGIEKKCLCVCVRVFSLVLIVIHTSSKPPAKRREALESGRPRSLTGHNVAFGWAKKKRNNKITQEYAYCILGSKQAASHPAETQWFYFIASNATRSSKSHLWYCSAFYFSIYFIRHCFLQRKKTVARFKFSPAHVTIALLKLDWGYATTFDEFASASFM